MQSFAKAAFISVCWCRKFMMLKAVALNDSCQLSCFGILCQCNHHDIKIIFTQQRYYCTGTVVECQTHDDNVMSLIPSSSHGNIFCPSVNFLWWTLFGYQCHPLLVSLLWHAKLRDPGTGNHCAKNASGRLWQFSMHIICDHVYTLDPIKSDWFDPTVQA